MAIEEITKDNFEQIVLKSDKPVLADFNASWCGPCQMIRPIIEEVASTNDQIKIVSINIDDEEELAEKYGISSIPCLVLFKNGEETKREIGLLSKKQIEKMVGA